MILALTFLFIIATFKWGDWKNWKKYYQTILFFILGDFVYLFIFSSKPLWQYTATLFSGTMTTLLFAFIIYPCTVLLFIPNYPRVGKTRKIGYILFWAIFYTILEYFELKFNYMQHFNGWCLQYSILFDLILFPLLLVHQKKPYLAWFISFVFCILVFYLFEVPLNY